MIENIFYNLFPLIFVTMIIIFDKKIAEFWAGIQIKYDKSFSFLKKKDKKWEEKNYKIYKIGFRIPLWIIAIIIIYLYLDIDFSFSILMSLVIFVKIIYSILKYKRKIK